MTSCKVAYVSNFNPSETFNYFEKYLAFLPDIKILVVCKSESRHGIVNPYLVYKQQMGGVLSGHWR